MFRSGIFLCNVLVVALHLPIGLTLTSTVLLISALWTNSSSSDTIYRKGRDAFTAVKTVAEQKRVLRKFEYLNYAGPHQSPLASYGADSLNFLRQVSKKYDPTGVFQSKVPGGFKLW